MPKPPSQWILQVPKLGEIHFRRFQGGVIGKTLFVKEESMRMTSLCPVHHVEVQGHTIYICPEEPNVQYEPSQLLKKFRTREGEEVTLSHEELMSRYPRSDIGKVVALVSHKSVTPDMISTEIGYYLVPIDNYDNILEYNQLVDLLLKDGLVAVTNKFRLRGGSLTTHNFLIFGSERQKCLLAVEFVPEHRTSPVPEEAKFRRSFITPEMTRESEKAKKELLQKAITVRE